MKRTAAVKPIVREKISSDETTTRNEILIPLPSQIFGGYHLKEAKSFTEADGAGGRAVNHILTFGPTTNLRARRIVQSIVEASTAPPSRTVTGMYLQRWDQS